MFKTVFAADIGSKCIKCVARGQVAAEETAIALEAGAKLTVAAAGNAALLHRSGSRWCGGKHAYACAAARSACM